MVRSSLMIVLAVGLSACQSTKGPDAAKAKKNTPTDEQTPAEKVAAEQAKLENKLDLSPPPWHDRFLRWNDPALAKRSAQALTDFNAFTQDSGLEAAIQANIQAENAWRTRIDELAQTNDEYRDSFDLAAVKMNWQQLNQARVWLLAGKPGDPTATASAPLAADAFQNAAELQATAKEKEDPDTAPELPTELKNWFDSPYTTAFTEDRSLETLNSKAVPLNGQERVPNAELAPAQ
ncbi:MAG: hypothetical protein AAF328_08805, partial [Planctomycetota bacterium]